MLQPVLLKRKGGEDVPVQKDRADAAQIKHLLGCVLQSVAIEELKYIASQFWGWIMMLTA